MTSVIKYLMPALAALALSVPGFVAQAQAGQIGLEDRQMVLTVTEKIHSFVDELDDLSIAVRNAPGDVYPDLIKRYNSAKLRWNTYYQSYQGLIADHEELMQAVAEYGMVDEELVASMEGLKAKMDAKIAFEDAVVFLNSQDSLYVSMYKRANVLSANQRLAGELEKLKGKEQLIFAEIQEKYDGAKAAVEVVPSLGQDMDALDDIYIALKGTSAKIQEAAFKPFVQRIKDYLIGIAAVAVVLMFFTMLQSKLKAAKQIKENTKKMMESLNKNKDDMPCI